MFSSVARDVTRVSTKMQVIVGKAALFLLFLVCNVSSHVLFPRYSVVQITGGISVPAILSRRSIGLNLGFQMNHDLPWSLDNFAGLYTGRSAHDIDKGTFYEYALNILESVGVDGEACLLRAICEAAKVPFHRTAGEVDSSDYLLEQIAHYLLTPSEDYQADNSSFVSIMRKSLVAEHVGNANGPCSDVFPCPLSLLDMFTNMYLT